MLIWGGSETGKQFQMTDKPNDPALTAGIVDLGFFVSRKLPYGLVI